MKYKFVILDMTSSEIIPHAAGVGQLERRMDLDKKIRVCRRRLLPLGRVERVRKDLDIGSH